MLIGGSINIGMQKYIIKIRNYIGKKYFYLKFHSNEI